MALAAAIAAGYAGSGGAALRFHDATTAAGIDFRSMSGGSPSRHILEVDGGGIALLDFDNDGDLDLFVANGATLERPEEGAGSRLWANRGDGSFEDVTAQAGITLRRWAMGVAVGDYDGDGSDDLYVTCFGPDVLLRNETAPGAGPRFREVTREAGLGDTRWSTSAAWGDLDLDGDLDLYVANYLKFDVAKPPPRDGMFQGVRVMLGPTGLEPQHDVLYQNLGDGRFRDVTREAGIVERTPGYGLGVRMFDYDLDGKLDIYVGNDSTGNFLFKNLGGMKFQDVAVRAGVATNGDGATQATMGIALGDVDGNGRADLFTTNFSHDTNTLQLSLADGYFDDRTSQYGLGLVSRPFLGWGAGLFDFDSDGDEDLWIANGHVYPEATYEGMGSDYEQTLLLFERRGPRFERVAEAAGEIFRRPLRGRAATFGDVDGDGDVDVVQTTLNGPLLLLRNDAPARRVLQVELRQRGANHRALGATVELEAAGNIQRRWITGGGSFQSADAPQAYFGLGDLPGDAPRTLRIRWPDGVTTRLAQPPLDRRIVVQREAPERPQSFPLRGR